MQTTDVARERRTDAELPEPLAATRPPVEIWRASLRAVYILWYRDLVRFWRDRGRLVGSLAMPVLYLVIFGTGLSSALGRGIGAGGQTGGGSLNYVTFMYPGIIGMTVLFTSIFGAMSIVWDPQFGFLKERLVAPIN